MNEITAGGWSVDTETAMGTNTLCDSCGYITRLYYVGKLNGRDVELWICVHCESLLQQDLGADQFSPEVCDE